MLNKQEWKGDSCVKKGAKEIALCGMFAGLSAAVLFFGGMLPLSTFLSPALAGMVLLPLTVECGTQNAVAAFITVAAIGVVTVPDREAGLLFLFFLGWYPICKPSLDKLRPAALKWLLKVLLFNGAVAGMYGLFLFLFPLPVLAEEFAAEGRWFEFVLWLLGNITYLVYDAALLNMRRVYCHLLRPRIFGKHTR